MIHLLTCFQTLADPDVLSEKEWIEGCASGTVDFSYIHKTINSFDESALELTCGFRDLSESEGSALSALTIGDKTNETALRTLAALGFGRIIRVEADEDGGTDRLTSEYAADIIASWARKQSCQDSDAPFDLIITGQRSGDWNQAKVPMLLADKLGVKCITNVTKFVPADDNGAIVTWLTDDAVLSAYIPYPAVLSIGDVSGTFLRVPTLKQKMASRQQPVEVETAYRDHDAAGCDNTGNSNTGKTNTENSSPVLLLDMTPVVERRDAVMIDGSDPEATAENMIRYLKEWTEA